MKILLLEPSESQRLVFCAMVEDKHRVEWTTSGELDESIKDKLESEKYDVVITAKELKNCEYSAVLKQLHSSQVNEETPIFLFSSNQNQELHRQAFDLGITGILGKHEITSLTEVLQNIVLFSTKVEGASVLFIEDDHALARFHKQLLDDFGFDVTLVDTVEKASDCLGSNEYELIITDLMLGEGGYGQQVIQQIRKNDKKNKARVPIIVTTSIDLPRCQTGLLYLGIDDFLIKPIPPRQLCLRAVRAVQNYRTAKLAVDKADQFRRNAMFDELTQVYNRNGYLEIAQRFVASCARKNTPLGVIFVDLDNFKPVNDTHGHAAGDRVLKEVASLLKEQTRDQDMVVRWGGDEFIVVLYDCDPKFLRMVASRILEAFKAVSQSLLGVSASMGLVNGTPTTIEQLSELKEKADQALYQAKENGRDQIVEYS